MDPIKKQLACPACGKEAAVRVFPDGQAHRWHCPHCKKMQNSEPGAVTAAPPAPKDE